MKLNKKFLSPLISLVVTGTLLVTIGVLTLGSSFGWFSHNAEVSASGISVSSVSPYKTEQQLCQLASNGTLVPLNDTTAKALFSDLVPGKSVTVYLRVINPEAVALNMELLFGAPSALSDVSTSETIDGTTNYYYFGSQLRVTSILACDASGTTTGSDLRIVKGKDAFLLTMPDSFYTGDTASDAVTQGVGVTTAYDFSTASQKKLTGEINVAAGATAYFAITFQFAENGQEQNPYINFGVTSAGSRGSIYRELLCWYSE